MKVARAYALGLSVVLAWSAADVLIAAWTLARGRASERYAAHELALYQANVIAVGFHEPPKLAQARTELQAQRPVWDAPPAQPIGRGSFDAFAAFAATLGVR